MSSDFFEVLRDGTPLHYLFYTDALAREWIKNHNDGANYSVRLYIGN